MGDTSFFVIGFCITLVLIKFIIVDVETLSAKSFNTENISIVIGAIFLIPLFETMRIIALRLINRKSAFNCDDNQLHHLLMRSGFNYFKSSIILGVANLSIAFSIIMFSKYLNSVELLGIMIFYFILFTIMFYMLKTDYKLKLN